MKKSDEYKLMNDLLKDLEMNYPYKVVKKLSEGVNSVVYQVVHTHANKQRRLAMKLILNPFVNEEKGR